jgi:transketolase
MIPFVYSIVSFAVLRAFEFIRNGPVAHRLPVRIVSVGGGMEYGHNGLTHFGLEDIAVLRTQKSLTTIVPAEAAQAGAAMRETWALPQPIYYRLGKDDRAAVPGLNGRFRLGRAEWLREGADVLVVAMGPLAASALAACDQLAARRIDAAVCVVASFNPAPDADLLAALGRYRLVVSVEAHYIVGGLGSWVAERIAETGTACRLIRCGVDEVPDAITGSQLFMERRNGLDAESLAGRIAAAMERT